jgi:hypothetical protein
MIEVMMSLVVFLTAAVGILAFQRALMRSNAVSNDLTAATYIARFWLERGRTESLLWNQGAIDLTAVRAPMLSAVQTGVGTPGFSTGWQSLPPTATRAAAAPMNRHLETWAPGLDRDYAEFCVQYRLSVLMPLEMLRMEVRVMWYREGAPRSSAGAAWSCPGANMVLGSDPDPAYVHNVQAATTLWRNQVVL